jgi:hypothetical protein
MGETPTSASKEELIKRAWERWFKADYSWEGLKKKSLRHSNKTYQDYWRKHPETDIVRDDEALRENGELIDYVMGDKTITYHIAHLPLHYQDGTPTRKTSHRDEVQEQLDALIIMWLNKAPFGGVVFLNLDLSRDRFEKTLSANFVCCFFAGKANFNRATFIETSNFSDTTFADEADFNEATFLKEYDIHTATFSGEANFSGTTFADKADFSHATFSAGVNFSKTTFQHYLSLSSVHFSITPNFSGIIWPKYAPDLRHAFDKASFYGLVDFSGFGFRAFAAFNGARFTQGLWLDIPNEAAKADKQFAIELKAAKNANDKFTRLKELEGGCRVLKQEMAKQSDRVTEQILFKFELIARREQLTKKDLEWWASHVYRLVSDYGASIWRPFLTLLLVTFITFPLTNAVFFNITGQFLSSDNWYYALSASLGRIFQFSIYGDLLKQYVNLLNGTGNPWWAFWFIFCGAIQSLISIILIFLLGLAIRRRFQIN